MIRAGFRGHLVVESGNVVWISLKSHSDSDVVEVESWESVGGGIRRLRRAVLNSLVRATLGISSSDESVSSDPDT